MMVQIIRMVLFLLVSIPISHGQNVWTGPLIEFNKLPFTDEHLSENQDRITDSIWITRASSGGLFNIFSEFDSDLNSPEGTLWALGDLDEWEQLEFESLFKIHQGQPPSLIGKPMVLFIPHDSIYLALTFTDWAMGNGSGMGSGGGFTYQRTTPVLSSLDLSEDRVKLNITPNPAKEILYLECHLDGVEALVFELYNKSGNLVRHTAVTYQEISQEIDIRDLSCGVYAWRLINHGGVFTSGKVVVE